MTAFFGCVVPFIVGSMVIGFHDYESYSSALLGFAFHLLILPFFLFLLVYPVFCNSPMSQLRRLNRLLKEQRLTLRRVFGVSCFWGVTAVSGCAGAVQLYGLFDGSLPVLAITFLVMLAIAISGFSIAMNRLSRVPARSKK
jgi:hypothetical protein